MDKIVEQQFTIENPLIKYHQVQGQYILPGLAYMDLLFRAAMELLGLELNQMSLKRLAIYNSLQVSADQPVSARIVFQEKKGFWMVRVEDHSKLYISAEIHAEHRVLTETIDPAAIMDCAIQTIPIDHVYGEARKGGVVHSGLLMAQGIFYRTAQGGLIDARVSADHAREISGVILHPTLLDGAGMAATNLIELENPEEVLFLPLSYETFYANAPVVDHCYVRIPAESIKLKNSLFSYNMEFFNEKGQQIAVLERFTAKQVRFAGNINPYRAKQSDVSSKVDRVPPVTSAIQTIAASQPASAASPADKHQAVEDILKKLFANYIEGVVPLSSGFFELGLESSQLLQLVKEIEEALGLSLSPSLLFEYSNIADLTDFLTGEVDDRIAIPTAVAAQPTECSQVQGAERITPGLPVLSLQKPLGNAHYQFSHKEAFLQDHLVYGRPALMGVTHPCLAIESYLKLQPANFPIAVSNIQFVGGPVGLEPDEQAQLRVEFTDNDPAKGFRVSHYVNDPSEIKTCCTGRSIGQVKTAELTMDIQRMIRQSKELPPALIAQSYKIIKGFQIGSMLMNIEKAYELNESTHIGEISMIGRRAKGNISQLVFDPLLLNSCYLLLNLDVLSTASARDLGDDIFIPLIIENLVVHQPMGDRAFVIKNTRRKSDDFLSFDALILDEDGKLVAELTNASLKRVKISDELVNFSQKNPTQDQPLQPKQRDIAIIGVSGKYPQANDLVQFWENLKNGQDCITEIPTSRWDWEKDYDPDKNKLGKNYAKWGGFIDGVDEFDPLFFNISPREAEFIDPQERLFLEYSYKALEDAGYTKAQLKAANKFSRLGSNVGVYVGVMYEEYQLYAAQEQLKGRNMALGSNPSSIANRVSYYFDFHGPSLAVDTMCSSSLTAIHLACQSLENAECELAIAGGVNVSIHPNKFFLLSQGKFASTKGRCESFGSGGDGYVPGEGVGVLILKPLAKAEQDGDHIYGVIKASVLNSGGKTSGYTVPNPLAQSELVRKALDQAGINARQISYVEAHGTGTALGDPIEIAGLNQAFSQDSQERQYCAIGSVKSNIGHLESAAGVASVTKVLLQMRHQRLVPSLHSAELNPNIKFGQTPFKVQQSYEPWISDGPRLAGISALGAGGANAHLIIQEYPTRAVPIQAQRNSPGSPVAMVFSARTPEALLERVQEFEQFIQNSPEDPVFLERLAFSLQTGKEALEYRLGFLAGTIAEARHKLSRFSGLANDGPELFIGEVPLSTASLAVDPHRQALVQQSFQQGKLEKVLELWVSGTEIDWFSVYDRPYPAKLSLPTYPFAKEKYWVQISTAALPQVSDDSDWIHPLVQQNCSTFQGQSFCSTFHGNESFVRDHQVNGLRILPAVVYLEMARCAVEYSFGSAWSPGACVSLEKVGLLVPTVFSGQAITMKIGLELHDESKIGFEISSLGAEGASSSHCRGMVTVNDSPRSAGADLALLRAQTWNHHIGTADLYSSFAAAGLVYGPAHQVIVDLWANSDNVFSHIILPKSLIAQADGFILHPSLMDGALQSIIGLMKGADSRGVLVPFAMDKITVFDRLPASLWITVQRNPGDNFDIGLYDDCGHCCALIEGLSARLMESKAPSEVLLFQRQWVENQEPVRTQFTSAQTIVCLVGHTNVDIAAIAQALPEVHIVKLAMSGTAEQTAHEFMEATAQLFANCQEWLAEKQTVPRLIQCLVKNQGCQRLSVGLAGMLKSLMQENPRFSIQLIELPADLSPDQMVAIHHQARHLSPVGHLQYQDGKILVEKLFELLPANPPADLPWKSDGIYLITGGMGGLGLVFAKEILTTTPGSTVVLTGRSLLDEGKHKTLQELQSLGLDSRVDYIACDVSSSESTRQLIETIIAKYGSLRGILHSAGVLHDNYLIKKTADEFRKVLSPKVLGSHNLDQATRDLPLDFFIMFSSLSAILGNAGQADYAAGNAFMDAFAHYRRELCREGQRSGLSIAINWPLWQDGGMVVPEITQAIMREQTGMVPLASSKGLTAFYQIMVGSGEGALVIQGDPVRVREKLAHREAGAGRTDGGALTVSAEENPELSQKTEQFLKQLLSDNLNVPVERISAQADLERYGIASVVIMQLTDQLEKQFGPLPKTLFYEYQNLEALGGYFMSNHRDRISAVLGIAPATAGQKGGNTPPPNGDRHDLTVSATRFFRPKLESGPTLKQADPIAIIGMAGRYPGAENLTEFWENLKNGENSVTEIPMDRWDWRKYFDADKNAWGKTYSKWGGFIDGVDEFDPRFFNILPMEAEVIDPQERIFLQCAYHTIEDAGYTPQSFDPKLGNGRGAKVGVYVGVMYDEYQLYGAQEQSRGNMIAVGGIASSVANRVSYAFNFQGPSMSVNTMCSSSLTAINLACRALDYGDCEVALAGGVNVSIHPNKYFILAQGRFASSKGECASFGHDGDGYVPGEGVGAVLLKPLSKAMADGDHIYGVIRGSLLNAAGKTNGFTVPNPVAQGELIKEAIIQAGVNPQDISYIEAHGTGTSLGDPIEINGLSRAFAEFTDQKQYCAIGSVKSNIGHLESASGIASLAKVLLQMKHRTLVPSLHAETLNPNINFPETPFFVQRDLANWEAKRPRLAGISSFGAGGSNGHLIVEEFIPQEVAGVPVGQPRVFIFSAKTQTGLQLKISSILSFLENSAWTDSDLLRIAYTLQVGREPMVERFGFVASSLEEAKLKMRYRLSSEYSPMEDSASPNESIGIKEVHSLIAEAVAMGNLSQIVDLWIRGSSIDWKQMYGPPKPQKISLPGYPFAKEKYWIKLYEQKFPVAQDLINEPIEEMVLGGNPFTLSH